MKARYLFLLSFALHSFGSTALEEITPCKFDKEGGIQPYKIPFSSRFTTKRPQEDSPNIIYYLTKPKQTPYPIAILCEGSSDREHVASVVHFHQYFLKELLDLNLSVLTVEKWGVDGDTIDQKEFTNHYTRSQRLKDHRQLIQSLMKDPPIGWNGKFVFLGVSEGGVIAEKLTEAYPDHTLATINWVGADGIPWREELWAFIQELKENPQNFPPDMPKEIYEAYFSPISTREAYDHTMDEIVKNPTPSKDFLSMSYAYHADALQFPPPNYAKLKTPFLVVSGTKDSTLASCDEFVKKAEDHMVPLTYFRVESMDHYIRKREDIQRQSFECLRQTLKNF